LLIPAPGTVLSECQKYVPTKKSLTKIDCVGFTHPRIRPEYADAEKVVNSIDKKPGVTILGMAPNEIACRRALNTSVDEIGVLISVSETFNRSVLGISVKKTLFKTIPAIIQACIEEGKTIRAFLLSAFWCQFEGRMEINSIVELVSKLSFLGVNEISLVDTPGLANPWQVKKTIGALLGLGLETNFAVHFHNTRGMGLANCLSAYEAGIRIFDTAVGGLDIDAIAESVKLAQKIAGRELPGHLLKARKAFVPSNFPNALALN